MAERDFMKRILVSSALGVCAVVALFALDADQHRDLVTADELATVNSYKSMLQNLAEMDTQIPLASPLPDKKRAAVHKEAGAKKAKHSIKASRCVLRRLMCAPPSAAPGGPALPGTLVLWVLNRMSVVCEPQPEQQC
jgi:hypothetical protein